MKPQLIDRIAAHIEAHGPATATEIHRALRSSERGTWSAINRGIDLGAFRIDAPRPCRITGHTAKTWALADDWRQIIERDHAMQRAMRSTNVSEANCASAEVKAWRAATRCPRDGRKLAVRELPWMTLKSCRCGFVRQVSRA